jgi:hypothetical protein
MHTCVCGDRLQRGSVCFTGVAAARGCAYYMSAGVVCEGLLASHCAEAVCVCVCVCVCVWIALFSDRVAEVGPSLSSLLRELPPSSVTPYQLICLVASPLLQCMTE